MGARSAGNPHTALRNAVPLAHTSDELFSVHILCLADCFTQQSSHNRLKPLNSDFGQPLSSTSVSVVAEDALTPNP
jgi:hypothetical protein